MGINMSSSRKYKYNQVKIIKGISNKKSGKKINLLRRYGEFDSGI